MKIESKHTAIQKPQNVVYTYLMDMNNVKELLPEGKYTEWKGEYDKCSFKMQGFGLSLVKDDATPSSEIKLTAGENSPIDFDLTIYISELPNNESQVFLICDARVNAFLKMMIEKPLTSLFDHMSGKLSRVEMK